MHHAALHFKNRSRELRRYQTPAEQELWRRLRDRRFLGVKFRRQHELGRFILDFYCEEIRLAIEMDGAPHLDPVVAERDSMRTQSLQREFGITLLRIENEELLVNPKIVMARIKRTIAALRK